MSRLAVLQWRTKALPVAIGLGILAVVLAVTGPHLVALHNTLATTCVVRGDCALARSTLLQSDQDLRLALTILMVVVPGLLGVFWGAPLVAREFEMGTYRLVWTQVHPPRWLLVELIVGGGASMAIAGLMSLMVTWWYGPIDAAQMMVYASFGQRDIVPMGYALLAFALGVQMGALTRRVLPAMMLTLIGFVGLQLIFGTVVRPHLLPPVREALAITNASAVSGGWGYGSYTGPFGSSTPGILFPPTPTIPNAWVYAVQLVNNSGARLTAQALAQACPLLGAGAHGSSGGDGVGGGTTKIHARQGAVLHACITKLAATYHEEVTYQPARQYWSLQWMEFAVYLALAVGLGGCARWSVRRGMA